MEKRAREVEEPARDGGAQPGGPPADRRRPIGTLRPLVLALTAGLLTGCGGEPPSSLAGFELGRTQREVLEEAERRGGFNCWLRGTRPPVTVCEGPSEEGAVGVTIRNDSVVRLVLRLAADEGSDDERGRAVRRFVRGFGEPAWRDRPVPPQADPPEGYHTLWLPDDSTRALALVCAREALGPPCTATLTPSTPAGVEAKLDTLLGIRR